MAIRANRVPVVSPLRSCWIRISIGRELVFAQDAHESEFPGLDGVAAHRAQRRVAVLVEGPPAERTVEVLDRKAGRTNGVAILFSRAANRFKSGLAALIPVHRVAFGKLAVPLLVIRDEGSALAGQFFRRQAAES